MASTPKLTQEQVINALAECKGMIFLTAKRLGVSHDTIERMIKRHPAVRDAKLQQRGEMVDEAEAKLWTAIRNGEGWAIALALKTQGKDRGYTERSEVLLLQQLGEKVKGMSDDQLLSLAGSDRAGDPPAAGEG